MPHIPFEVFRKYEMYCEPYIPKVGEKFEILPQLVTTCIMKLVYGYYEHGIVFDDSYTLKDKQPPTSNGKVYSDCANWLCCRYTPNVVKTELKKIKTIKTYEEYELILYNVCEELFHYGLVQVLDMQMYKIFSDKRNFPDKNPEPFKHS